MFFLGRFREDAESVCEQLANANIAVDNYPRQYEELEKNQKLLVENVDKKLLGWSMSSEGAKAHQSHIESILKFIEFMGYTIPKGLVDDDYSYYLNPLKGESVKKVGGKIAKMRQERVLAEEQKRAETERQRDEVWADSSMKMFPANLSRADVLASRNIVGKELEDKILVKVVSELLTDKEFWNEIVRPFTDEGRIVRYDIPGRFWLDLYGKIASPGEVKTRILEHAAKEAARCVFNFQPFKFDGVVFDLLDASPEKLEKLENAMNENRPSMEEIITSAKTGISMSIPRKPRSGDLDGLGDLFSHGASEVFEGWKKNQYHFNWGEMEDLYRDLENSGYFAPDDWVSNLREMLPIVKGPSKFDYPVSIRLNEIRRSYFFGNWLSVIALSRCLMEYVLIRALGENAYTTEKGESKLKRLDTLVAEMSKQKQELKTDMKNIQDWGNSIMHPRNINGDILSKNAPDCFRGIVHIVSVLGK